MFKIYYILTYPITLVFLFFLWIYRKVIRYALPKSCHFLPTCSEYAFLSIKEFGFFLGSIYAVNRLCKCAPNKPAYIDYPKLNLLGNYKWKC